MDLSVPVRRAPRQLLTRDRSVTYLRRVNDDDRVFKALADPTRRFLLDRLFARDGRTLTDLESELEMTRVGVMKHLRVRGGGWGGAGGGGGGGPGGGSPGPPPAGRAGRSATTSTRCRSG